MQSLRDFLNETIDRFQKRFRPNRLVAIFTPVAFAPAAAYITSWAATHLPGLPHLSSGEVTGLFAAGALAAVTTAYKWLDGWQKHEANLEAETQRSFENVQAKRRALVDSAAYDPSDDPDGLS